LKGDEAQSEEQVPAWGQHTIRQHGRPERFVYAGQEWLRKALEFISLSERTVMGQRKDPGPYILIIR